VSYRSHRSVEIEADVNFAASLRHSSGRGLNQMVENACRHWEARRNAVAVGRAVSPQSPHVFTIAISCEAGTLGTLVARDVGKRLGWQVYDNELLERIAQQMGIRAALLNSVDERQQSWIVESLGTFLAAPNKPELASVVSEAAFVRHLVETVLALGAHGECVILGRGAAFILPIATTLRVRLVAPVKERVATLSRTLDVSAKDAARHVRATDRLRYEFVKGHFFKDPTDPQHYHLVLNSGQLSIATEAGLIIDTLRYLQTSTADQQRIGSR
jgi:cytidylate kinase